MAKGSLRVNGIIVDTDGEIKASTGDAIVIREDDGSAVITVDTSGNTLINGDTFIGGNTAAESLVGITPRVQVEGVGYADSSLSLFNNSNDTNSASLYIGKSRGTALSSDTIVQDGDFVGGINFIAADGTDRASRVAAIYSAVDGTPGANDTPGELLFYTVADGANALTTAQMVIKADGKVGIGTTAPITQLNVAGADPAISIGTGAVKSHYTSGYDLGVLQIGNSFIYGRNTSDASNFLHLGQNSYFGTDGNYKFALADEATLYTQSGGNHIFNTAASGTADATITYTEIMRLASNGNVGIGSTSPSSTFRTSINGDGSSVIGGVEFRNAASGGSTITVGMASATSPSGKINVVSAGNLILQTNDTERMRIDSSGNVGIGTTAPTTLLHVNGASAGIKIEEDTDNDYMLIDVVQGGRARIGMNDTRVLTIQENGGRVGIGTTASGNQLTVVTTDYADSNATYPYTGATLHLKTTANQSGRGCGIVFSDGQEDKGFITMNGQGGRAGDLRFYTRASGGTVGFAMRIASNGTVYTTGGTVSNISDIRIKKDVVDLTDGLDIVNQLKPRKFKFNGKNPMAVNDGETHYGFVADEVLSVASQYVELTTDNIDGERLDDVKTISTGKMIPMLVNAVKELSAEVTALKSAG